MLSSEVIPHPSDPGWPGKGHQAGHQVKSRLICTDQGRDMRKLPLFMAVAWSASLAAADAGQFHPVPPVQVTRELVQGALANDLDAVALRLDCAKVAMGPHGRSLADAVTFLRTVDLDTAELLGTSVRRTPPPEHERVVLRTPDHEFRFDLELRDRELLLGEAPYSHRELGTAPRYVVTEIHQHP